MGGFLAVNKHEEKESFYVRKINEGPAFFGVVRYEGRLDQKNITDKVWP